MEVREVTEKEVWEHFLLQTRPNTFLQNWNWGVFNESIGRKIFRLGIFSSNKLIGVCLLLKYESRIANYFYAPRGPVLNWGNTQEFELLLTEIKNLARSEKADFLKLDPIIAETSENQGIFSRLGFKRAVTYVQVEDAWLLDLSKSEDELLSEMRKTTRYLIRNEPKQGIEVVSSKSTEDIKEFADLLYQTAGRKNFVNHPKEYYIKQFEIMANDDQMLLFKALKDNKVQAMAVVAYYGDSAYYLHGASTAGSSSVGYSLQWEAIKEAKKRGMSYYNFWGVVKDKNFHPGHPWYGFSLFKKGFGGFKYSYLRAQDLPYTNKYWLYRAAEKTRRVSRRLSQGYWED